MVGEGERGEGDVGFLSSGDAGCGNARQPGNQITDHSARCQPWLIFHSTRVAARLGPAERQGGGHLQRAAKHGPPHLSVFLPSARGRELSLGENHVKVKMVQNRARTWKAGTHFSHWVHRFYKRDGLRFCPGERADASMDSRSRRRETGSACPLHPRSRPGSSISARR
jgi:hypothetical protein